MYASSTSFLFLAPPLQRRVARLWCHSGDSHCRKLICSQLATNMCDTFPIALHVLVLHMNLQAMLLESLQCHQGILEGRPRGCTGRERSKHGRPHPFVERSHASFGIKVPSYLHSRDVRLLCLDDRLDRVQGEDREPVGRPCAPACHDEGRGVTLPQAPKLHQSLLDHLIYREVDCVPDNFPQQCGTSARVQGPDAPVLEELPRHSKRRHVHLFAVLYLAASLKQIYVIMSSRGRAGGRGKGGILSEIVCRE